MIKPPDLDMALVRAFVTVSEQSSFTHAGDLLGATQSTVSARIKKLEDCLGQRLLARSPQSVELTQFGEGFLAEARSLLAQHDAFVDHARQTARRRSFRLAVSDHVAGSRLTDVLSNLARRIGDVQLLVTVMTSTLLAEEFAKGRFDAIIIRQDDGPYSGTALFKDRLVWCAAENFSWERGDVLPLVSLSAPCAVRTFACDSLRDSGIRWAETFVATGIDAARSAITAGFGIGCLDTRNVPANCRDVGGAFGLPALPATQIVMLHRNNDREISEISELVAESFRSAAETTIDPS